MNGEDIPTDSLPIYIQIGITKIWLNENSNTFIATYILIASMHFMTFCTSQNKTKQNKTKNLIWKCILFNLVSKEWGIFVLHQIIKLIKWKMHTEIQPHKYVKRVVTQHLYVQEVFIPIL